MNSLARSHISAQHYCPQALLLLIALTALVDLPSPVMATGQSVDPNRDAYSSSSYYYPRRTLQRRSVAASTATVLSEENGDSADAMLKDLGYGYNLPECLPNEACLYRAFGHRFEMCQCPGAKLVANEENDGDDENGENECPERSGNAVHSQGITYNFCNSSTVISTCQTGQLSMSVKYLRSVIHCRCRNRATHALRKRRVTDGETQFFCELKTTGSRSDDTVKERTLRRRL